MALKEMLLTGAMAATGVYAAEAQFDAIPVEAAANICSYPTTPDGPWGFTASTGLKFKVVLDYHKNRGDKNDTAEELFAQPSFDYPCGNGVTETTPTSTPAAAPNTPLATQYTVSNLQAKTNELLAGYGMPQVITDGKYGNETKRAVCTAEWLLGLDNPSRHVIKANSDTAKAIMTASGVLVPPKARGKSGQWADANKTCQSVVFGTDSSINMIFKTSSGDLGRGMDTPVGDNFKVQAYDPAPLTKDEIENGTKRRAGWHDSSTAPSPSGRGNMYKPIYFNGGVAFHGADQVPTFPASHKCLRLTPANMDRLILWAGLGNRISYTTQSLAKMAIIVEGAYDVNS